MRLEGKRILVTGDASGIGRAVALQVAREGARVAATDVNEAAGAALIDEIAASGGTAYFWSADVTDEESVETMTGAAIEWLGGGIDVLLHVAGVLFGAGGDIRGFEESTWDAVVDVNLKGSYLVSKYASRPMLRDGKGVMVMTASGAGVLGGSSSYAYESSKGGVHGLSMVLDRHLGPKGIRVHDVLPGNIETPLKVTAEKELAAHTGDEQRL